MTYEILSTPVNSPASLLFKQCLAEFDPDNRLLNSAMNEVGGYFLNKTDFGGEGYFAEVFIKFANIEYDRNTYFYDDVPNEPYLTSEEIKAWDIAPGVGVGRKWVNKKGWTFEYMLGFGRYLFASSQNDNPDSNYEVENYRPEATFKGGISIGKRF